MTIYERGTIITTTTELVVETCYKCQVPFAMPKEMQKLAKDRGYEFFCPNGHGQVYGKTSLDHANEENERLKKRLELEQRWHRSTSDDLRRQRRTTAHYKGEVTKIKKRVSNGVCPCCNRHFENLERHMATKHPDFVANPDKDGENG